MKKYLSIGEVAKIKGVSHTSLRYYDEIGILVPAYTNPDTGYRYYSKNQMIFLDIIQLAVGLGMPLKNLEKYMDSESIDIESFTLEAQKIINKSIKKFQRDLYFLETTSKFLKENEKNLVKGKEYIREIEERYFIALPSNISFTGEYFEISDYWKLLTELYLLLAKHELFISIDQGIYFYKEKDELKSMVYVEIKKVKKKKVENAKIIQIPKGSFLCAYYPDSCLKSASEKYLKDEVLKKGNIMIISDVLEKKISKKVMLFEIQIILNK